MQQEIIQPVVKTNVLLSSGVRVYVHSFPRAVKSSSRCDAKTVGFDFGTIYTSVKLYVGNDHSHDVTLVRSFSEINDYVIDDVLRVCNALNASGDSDKVLRVIEESRALVLEHSTVDSTQEA